MPTRLMIMLCALVLSGCASMYKDPYIRGFGSPAIQKVEDEAQRDKLSYLARYLLTADDRQKQEARIKKVHPGWTEFDTHGALSMATSQALTGNMFSNSGTQVYATTMAALTVASFLLPDGSMDTVSGVYLPSQFEGTPLENDEQARLAFWQWREKQIAAGAGAFDRAFRCIYQCESPAMRIYELRLAPGQVGSKYAYNPPIVYVRAELYQGKLQPAPDDALLAWALGFVPKWASANGNTAPITLLEAALDKEGKPKFQGEEPLINRNEPLKTTFGRDLMRRIYAGSDYDFMAQRGFGKDKMAYKGEIYTFPYRHTSGFIQFKYQERPDPPASNPESGG